MDRTSTRDHYERETEESERLIHQAPKVKPPRHDKRRETVRPDLDPDIAADPDIARDEDLSLNRKNIGGSVQRVAGRFLQAEQAWRVAQRFLQADIDRTESGGEDEYVAVVNKETGENTHVKKDTLKGPDGSKYKIVEKETAGPAEGDVAGIYDLAEKNPQLKGMLQILSNPKHKEYGTLNNIPDKFPLTQFKLEGLPEGVKTMGDLRSVVQSGPPKKKPKPKPKQEAPKPKQEPPKAAPREEANPVAETPSSEKPKGEGEAKEPEEGPQQPEEPKEPDYERTPEPEAGGDEEDPYGGPSREDKASLKSWLAENGPKKPEFKAWADKQKTVTEKDGELLFPKGKKRVPLSQLSLKGQLRIKDRFETDTKHERNVEALKGLARDKETRQLLRELGNPSSELRKRLDQTARDDDARDLSQHDVAKTIPEVAHLSLPDGIGSVQDLIDAAEKGYAPPPEPERSRPNKQETRRSEMAIEATFPEDVAEEIAGMQLHPDDVSDLVSSYTAAMNGPTGHKSISALAKTMSAGGYNLDPESVDVPEKDEEGRRFEDLSPPDQAKVYAKHKMALLATSLAARQKVSKGLEDAGLPGDVAQRLAHEMLQAGDRDVPDENVRTFYKEALSTAAMDDPLSDSQVQHLLKVVGDNPAAKKLAVAYLQAKDYADARETYLEKDPEHPDRQIKEWDDVKTIARKLAGASDFLKERSDRYPKESLVEDTGMEFRNRVVDRLGALVPESVPFVRKYLEDYEMDTFKEKDKSFSRESKKYDEAAEKEKKAVQKERAKNKPREDAYREKPEEELTDDVIEARLRKRGIHRPRRPTPPPGYEYWSNKPKVEQRGSKAMDWFKKLFNRKKKSSAEVVALRHLAPNLEQRVALRYAISSYPGGWTMGQSSPAVRTAVYWGQEPYEQTAPYPGWTQVHARDIDEKDMSSILGAARSWLDLPVLGREIKGMVRDTQLRAALDLALRDHEGGKYSVGVHPTVYNQLLAKLAGEGGPYELLTGKPSDVPVVQASDNTPQTRQPMGLVAGSTYGLPGERSRTMKASAHVRVFASRAASADRDQALAFDLMSFADHLAAEEQGQGEGQAQGQQEPAQQAEQQKQAAVRVAAQQLNKFNSLRALIIRTATEHPEAREAFMPILQALKG